MERVPQLEQVVKAVSPLGRVATVEEVADYIVFLCSPGASYINGTGLPIDLASHSVFMREDTSKTRCWVGRDR